MSFLLTPVRLASVVVLLSGWLITAAPAQETASGVEIESVTIGIRNHLHLGKWTPLVVQVEIDRPVECSLLVTSITPDGNLATMPSEPYTLAQPGTHRLETVFLPGRVDAEIGVTLHIADGATIERRLRPATAAQANDFVVLKPNQVLIATLGNPAGFADDERDAPDAESSIDAQPTREVVALTSSDELPALAGAYDALRVLVVAGDYRFDESRNAAIREWVHGGGHLVLAVASARDEYAGSRFPEWVPIRITGEMLLRELSSLETFVKARARVPLAGRVPAVRLESSSGLVLAASIDGPILARAPYGMGRVTMLGVDLDRPPLTNWEMMPAFAAHLGDLYESDVNKSLSDRFARISSSNVSDLSSQLLGALETFPQVERVSIWMVIGWMIVCLAVIGFGDYLLVKYVFRRPEWTWFTLPILVVAGVSLAAWGAAQTNGSRLQVNSIDVVDIDAASQTMRVNNYATVYSPETRRYRVDVQIPTEGLRSLFADEPTEELRPRIGWFGVPESSFGGMYRTGGFNLTEARYRFAPAATGIENLPIPIWSAKTLQSQAQIPVKNIVESKLVSTGVGQLKGTVVHHFPVPLDDWFMAYGTRVFRPRVGAAADGSVALPPNRPWDPGGSGVFQRELKGFLTGTIASRSSEAGKTDQIIVEQTPYDPGSRDAFEIIRIATFYDVVGGKDYTRLTNDLFARPDFPDLMDLHRAVLFGRIETPVTSVSLDGVEVAFEKQITVVRIVLPVDLQIVQRRNLPTMDPNAERPKNIFTEDDDE